MGPRALVRVWCHGVCRGHSARGVHGRARAGELVGRSAPQTHPPSARGLRRRGASHRRLGARHARAAGPGVERLPDPLRVVAGIVRRADARPLRLCVPRPPDADAADGPHAAAAQRDTGGPRPALFGTRQRPLRHEHRRSGDRGSAHRFLLDRRARRWPDLPAGGRMQRNRRRVRDRARPALPGLRRHHRRAHAGIRPRAAGQRAPGGVVGDGRLRLRVARDWRSSGSA